MTGHDHEPSAFTRRLHAGFAVADAALADVVRRATGERLVASERIVRGQINEVHRVATARGRVVVRINRTGDADFAGETWAMDLARTAGVPVPDVLLVDRLVDAEDDLAVMVLSELPGRPLSDLEPGLSPTDRCAVLSSAGRVLAMINSVRTPGAWRSEPDGRWSTWAEIREGALAERRAERPQLIRAGLTAGEADQTFEVMQRYYTEHAWTEPVLCHGDFVPEHLFVDDDLTICGVLDFGMFHGGAPVTDLAYLRLTRPDLDHEAVLDGWGADPDDHDLRHERDLHAITHAVGYTAACVTTGDVDGARRLVASLRGLLQGLAPDERS